MWVVVFEMVIGCYDVVVVDWYVFVVSVDNVFCIDCEYFECLVFFDCLGCFVCMVVVGWV